MQANWTKKRRLACEPSAAVKQSLSTIKRDMFCWGSTIHGELGLGGIEDENVLTPREVDFEPAADIEQSKFLVK